MLRFPQRFHATRPGGRLARRGLAFRQDCGTIFGGVARVHVLTAAVLFGTTGTAQALGPEIEPLAVGTARIAIGAALLVVIALVSGRFQLGGADRRLVLLSGACVAAYQATFFAAVDDTGVAVGTVVAIGSAPVFTGLLRARFAGEQLTRRWAGATALGCAGVCTLVLGSGSGGEVSMPGVGLALLAGAGYAGYAVRAKAHGPGSDPGSTDGIGVLHRSVVLIPCSPLCRPEIC